MRTSFYFLVVWSLFTLPAQAGGVRPDGTEWKWRWETEFPSEIEARQREASRPQQTGPVHLHTVDGVTIQMPENQTVRYGERCHRAISSTVVQSWSCGADLNPTTI